MPELRTPEQAAAVRPDPGWSDFISAARISDGTCYALFAYDAGFSIDLEHAERCVAERAAHRKGIERKRPAPPYFDYRPLPLCVTHVVEPFAIGDFSISPRIEVLIFDFGAVSVTYLIDLHAKLDRLIDLSSALYENQRLLQHSRKLVEELLSVIGPSVSRASLAGVAEDYAIYELATAVAGAALDRAVDHGGAAVARLLRGEAGGLSQQEIADALSCQIAYSPGDRTLVDWNAAVILDRKADDVRAVLEFANVQLLESRLLDERLHEDLDRAYEAMTRQSWRQSLMIRRQRRALRRVAELEIDGAMLYEGVNNALKLIGDQHLARVYRLTAQRLHLAEWQASIEKKLATLGGIYQRMTDQHSSWRMEILEWIIIVLIAVSIVLPFVVAGK